MILQEQQHTLQRGGLTGERQYSIALSPKIYGMMSAKLYTDRIGSTVREVCSNAWDAQKMASIASGNPIEPFKVTLPTDLEPHFVVEDTGPGMPDEVAQDLYSTLGLSTKEQSNDQIGAFGLGSKSPFAVTDTFTVENTYAGITHFYLCFKTEGGLPSLLKTGERNEGRTNGVKVIIPSAGRHYKEYESALNKQLVMMEPKPILNNIGNFEFTDPVKRVVNEFGYTLVNAKQFSLNEQAVYAKMGMVLYPIDNFQIQIPINIHSKLKGSVVLEFPIGAIEPLPSREGLTYDERTKKNIRDIYVEYAKDYKVQLKEELLNIEDPLDAWNEIAKIKNDTGIDFRNDGIKCKGFDLSQSTVPNVFPAFFYEWEEDGFEYVDTPLSPEDDPLDYPSGFKKIAKVKKVKKSGYVPKYRQKYLPRNESISKGSYNELKELSFTTMNSIRAGGTKYILMDELNPKYRVPRLKKAIASSYNYGDQLHLIEMHPGCTDPIDFTDWYEAINSVTPRLSSSKGNTITDFSDIPRPEKAKSGQNEANIDGVSYIHRKTMKYEKYIKWSELNELLDIDEDDEEEDIVTSKEIFYVTSVRNDLDLYGQEVSKFVKLLEDYHILIVRKTGKHQIPKLEALGIKEFQGFIADKLKDFAPSEDYKKKNSAAALVLANTSGSWYQYSSILMNESVTKELKSIGHPVHPFFDLWHEVLRLSSTTVADSIEENKILDKLKNNNLLRFFKDAEWIKLLEIDLTTEFDEKLKDFMDKYPLYKTLLLTLAPKSSSESINSKIIQYVKDYNILNGFQPPIVVIDIDDDIPF